MLPLLSRQRWQTTASARTACISWRSISPVSREIYTETPSSKGQSHTEWQHWTVQYLLDMYKNKIACCKAAQCWNTEFQFSCCVKDTSIREEQSQEQRHSVPVSQRSVCTQTPIQTSLSHIIAVPGLPGSALWSQTDAWTLASTQIPQQTSASSSCNFISPVTCLCPSQKPKVASRENAFLGTQKFCREIGIGAAVI